MFNFGAGRAMLTPLGATATTGSSVELGTVQSASLELKVDMKELRGPFRYPVAVADGKGTCSGKVTFANIWPYALQQITGGTTSVGAPNASAAINETSVVPASTPYTYTLAQGATFLPFTELVTVVVPAYGPVSYVRGTVAVSATPTTPTGGIYTIVNATGALTFNVADAGRVIHISYLYSTAGAPGDGQVGVALAQVGMNSALTFQLNLIGTGRDYYTNGAQQFIVQLNACLAPSLKMDFKLDDFTMLDVDFEAFIDINGNLGDFFLLNP